MSALKTDCPYFIKLSYIQFITEEKKMLLKAISHTGNTLIISIFPKCFIAAWREKLLMHLLIFLSDFLASPKKPVYSCIFKLLAGKACFREYDCKYDKENNYFRVSIFLVYFL